VTRGGSQFVPRPPNAVLGGPPPWEGIEDPASRIDRSVLEEGLRLDRPDEVLPMPGLRDAAVLVPFVPGPSGLDLVFVKRGSSAPTHAGEVAFPGGTMDALDSDPRATALREAHEEVGLDSDRVEVLGMLERTGTVATAFRVTPFVGWLTDADGLVPQPGEIDAVLRVPLRELLHPDAYHAEDWMSSYVAARAFEVHFFDIEGETIWGLTARILHGLFDRVFTVLRDSGPDTPMR